jgi:hypothetical protein
MSKKQHSALNKYKKKGYGIMDLGLRTLLVIVFLTIVYYFFKQLGEMKIPLSSFSPATVSIAPNITLQPTVAINQFEWKTYESKEFGFSLKYPASLRVNDLGNNGGYVGFIRFEEEPSLNLSDKGIAVGISSLPLDKEITKIKDQINSEGGAILVDETQTVFKGFTATRLYYKPEDSTQEEERVVIIVNGGGEYTYSISTVPGQIQKVLEGFNFIKS